MQTLLHATITIILIIILLLTLTFALFKQEEHECLVWAEQAKQSATYYYTPTQKAQCHIE